MSHGDCSHRRIRQKNRIEYQIYEILLTCRSGLLASSDSDFLGQILERSYRIKGLDILLDRSLTLKGMILLLFVVEKRLHNFKACRPAALDPLLQSRLTGIYD